MALVKINKDGIVETLICTQDVGGGSRTVAMIATSMAFGYLPTEKIRVFIGDSNLPPSITSMASATTSAATREVTDAAKKVLKKLFEIVADHLKEKASNLEIKSGGKIFIKGQKEPAMTWDEATSKIKDTLVGFAIIPFQGDAIVYIQTPEGKLKQIKSMEEFASYYEEQYSEKI